MTKRYDNKVIKYDEKNKTIYFKDIPVFGYKLVSGMILYLYNMGMYSKNIDKIIILKNGLDFPDNIKNE